MTEHGATEVAGQGSTAASPGQDDHEVLHGDEHDGHDDDHGREALGPIDVAAWGLGAAGVLLGLVVVAGFVLAAGWVTP